MPNRSRENYRQNLKIPKSILLTAKALELISSNLAVKFAANLFQTPVKYPTPKRELQMESHAVKSFLEIPEINKTIQTYTYGKGKKKALLIHGWSGRGTQLVKIADALVDQGYTTFSFDGPAHGKSSGKTTNMLEFSQCIMEMERKHGPFDTAIGHSLGSMALLYSVKEGLGLKSAVLVGTGDKIEDIIYDFTDKLGLKRNIGRNLKDSFDKKFNFDINNLSASVSAKDVKLPLLVIHDQQDFDSPVEASIKINKIIKNSKLVLTQGLGHRKILGDQEVIRRILEFIESASNKNVTLK